MQFHLIGIGGAGMSVLAQMLAAQGHEVSGSDKADSPIMRGLRENGITAHVGHDASVVPEGATVVVSSAIKPDNPEYAIALRRTQTVWHRSQALAFAARDEQFIAVAGAHGKTTTSAMLATILMETGADPSFAIGSVLPAYNTGARRGNGGVCVAEADESDGSFLNYQPAHAIITNIEPDHLDHYGSEAAFFAAFEKFCDLVGGSVFCCADDAGARRLIETKGEKCIGYGKTAGQVRLQELADGAVAYSWGDTRAVFTPAFSGAHNLLNGLAAWALAVKLGIDPDSAATALAGFSGTARRFQNRGEVANIRVIDDYAHHPTEVAAAIAQAKAAALGAKVIVIFQPHLYSRTRNFAERFATALDQADLAIVTDIYPAREAYDPHVTAETITRHGHSLPVADLNEAAKQAVASATSGDIIMTVGAGDITNLADPLLALLREKVGEA